MTADERIILTDVADYLRAKAALLAEVEPDSRLIADLATCATKIYMAAIPQRTPCLVAS